MKLWRRRVVVAAAVAVVVELLSAAGWWSWSAIQGRVSITPKTGVERLATSALAVTPSGAMWLRRLRLEDLEGVDADAASAALGRLARAQRRYLPVHPVGWVNVAYAALLTGDTSAAVERVSGAVRRDPTSPYLHRLTAFVLLKEGRYDEALDELAQAEALAPGYRQPQVDVLPGDDQWVRLEGLRKSADVYPRKRADALLAYSAELRRRGRTDEMAAALAPVADAPQVRIQEAGWALEEGRAADAIEQILPVVENRRMPARIRSRALAILASAYDARDQAENAERAAAAAVKLTPNSPWPYVALSRMARRRGDYETSLRYIRKAWGVAPADVKVLLEVGSVAERAGSLDDARLAFERAAQLAPDRPAVAARNVDFLLRHGRFMDAALKLSTYLDRFPTDPGLLRLAARLEQATTGRRR